MKVEKQIYLNKSIFIDSKTTKITDNYQFIREVAKPIDLDCEGNGWYCVSSTLQN